MKTIKVPVLIWLFATMPAFGAVEAILFHVTTSDTYTVPAGKVLIIERATYMGPGLHFQNGTNSFELGSLSDPDTGVSLPLKFPEGWTLRGITNTFQGATDTWIFGLLVSPSDLFASVPHRIDQIAVNGGMASLGIQTVSPRPARIEVEKSSEVDKGWHAADNAVVAPTVDKTRYTATVPVEGNKGFIRTKARPRER
jgi:hypothetical protein